MTSFESVDTALAAIDRLAQDGLGDLEVAGEIRYADTIAAIITQALPKMGMNEHSRAYWLKVAEYLSQEEIAAFKKVGAFMSRVKEFQ